VSAARAPRRGSFLETMALFAGGRAWWLGLLGFGAVGIAALPARTAGMYFVAMGVMVVIWFSASTALIEEVAKQKLAFMTLVPQPIANKWLVLVPNCAGAVVPAVVQAVFGKLPAVSSLSMVGCALWTIGVIRWTPFLRLLALPALPLAPLAAWAAYRMGGWGGASAAALALGLGAIAFQTRVIFDFTSTPLRARAPARAVGRVAVSRAGSERAGWLASAVRFLLLCTAQLRKFNLANYGVLVAACFLFTIPGMMLFIFVILMRSNALTEAYSGETYEFLRARPFSRGQRFVGGVLIPLLAVVVPPTLALLFVDANSINTGGLVGRLFPSWPKHGQDLAYLRDIVGATFLPDTWPPGGLTPEMWTRVRPLLWIDHARVTTIVVAALFSSGFPRGPR
jgi:hypothetical protein